ncbi:SRPBCC domain-containing protein [Niveibacterium sp. 24ML]|uniref:SRPBCC domain-containing protein n=1 Tax=Niveibacterium sp. 24ML TaxID=2985512 RepID=UPI00226D498B|nr:SRPBCC domain-containing protein [Niveibacterium sp. 24ML]
MRTTIDIQASPNQVWSILTDFSSYPEWNPFIREVRGEPIAGRSLNVSIVTASSKTLRSFWPRVLASQAPRELRWQGRLLAAGLLDGEQRFKLVQRSDGSTRLVHSQCFTGLLVPLLRMRLDREARPGFEAMNTALKSRAEARK